MKKYFYAQFDRTFGNTTFQNYKRGQVSVLLRLRLSLLRILKYLIIDNEVGLIDKLPLDTGVVHGRLIQSTEVS